MTNNPTTSSDEIDPEIQSKLDKLVVWSELPSNHFIHRVEKGRMGGNIGMSNGMKGVSKYIYGTHRARYYLFGADSGTGKTTIGDFMFVLQAWKWAKEHQVRLHIIYYSFEISKEEKKARWVSYFIKLKFGIEIPSDYILGRIPGMMVSDHHMEMIRIAYLAVEDIMENIIFGEDSVNPTKMWHDMIEHHYEKIGTVLRHPAKDKKKKGLIRGYEPKPGHEDDFTIVIVDHLALAMNEQGFDTKQTMDLWSKYTVALRNLFGMSAVYIQQFNTELTSTFRMNKKGEGLMAPQRIDFGDSRYTFRDADVVMSALKPQQYDISTFHDYDITELGGYFLALYLMKNRYGTANRMIPLFLNPVAGIPEDLPLTPNAEIAMQPFYDKAKQLEDICSNYQPAQ